MIDINAQTVNISFESLKKEESRRDSVMDVYLKMSNNDLLKNGFYKVVRNDSLFYFLENKQVLKFLDFNNIEKSLAGKALININKILDSIQIHYKLSTSKKLYNSNPQIHNNLLFSLNTKEQQESKSHISENYYHSFPKNWFGSLSNDNFRINPGFSITVLYLVDRGYYFKLKNINPLLSKDFHPDKYIKQTVSSKDSMLVCVSLLDDNQTVVIKRDGIDLLLDSISNPNDFKLSKDGSNFSDYFSIVSIAYYPLFRPNSQIDKLNFGPKLELIFSLENSNKLLLISTGEQYNLYNFENIEFLQKIID
jgi:hypothetical protein